MKNVKAVGKGLLVFIIISIIFIVLFNTTELVQIIIKFYTTFDWKSIIALIGAALFSGIFIGINIDTKKSKRNEE